MRSLPRASTDDHRWELNPRPFDQSLYQLSYQSLDVLYKLYELEYIIYILYNCILYNIVCMIYCMITIHIVLLIVIFTIV